MDFLSFHKFFASFSSLHHIIPTMDQNKILRNVDEMTASIFAVMIAKESSVYHCKDYLSSSSFEVTADDRKKLVDWCFCAVDVCSFQPETVVIAINLLDRYLSIPSEFGSECLQDRREFQLLALSCLYIAIKTNERIAFSSQMVSELSHGGYTVEEIEHTEKIILCGLSWRVNGPTSLQMALHILSLMGIDKLVSKQSLICVINEVAYQTERATQDYYNSIQRPSTVALMILIKAFQQLDDNTRIELFASSLPLLQAFDFDRKCKRSVAAGCVPSVSRLPVSTEHSSSTVVTL
jgi:hypothetical protein